MVKLVDYEAVQNGKDFTFIKTLKEDGSIDPRIGSNGPYSISSIAVGDGISISHAKGLTTATVEKMLRQFAKEYL